jgi:hypothetical protein
MNEEGENGREQGKARKMKRDLKQGTNNKKETRKTKSKK